MIHFQLCNLTGKQPKPSSPMGTKCWREFSIFHKRQVQPYGDLSITWRAQRVFQFHTVWPCSQIAISGLHQDFLFQGKPSHLLFNTFSWVFIQRSLTHEFCGKRETAGNTQVGLPGWRRKLIFQLLFALYWDQVSTACAKQFRVTWCTKSQLIWYHHPGIPLGY